MSETNTTLSFEGTALEILEGLGCPAVEVARRLGVSRATVARLRYGLATAPMESGVDSRRLAGISRLLVAELLGRVDSTVTLLFAPSTPQSAREVGETSLVPGLEAAVERARNEQGTWREVRAEIETTLRKFGLEMSDLPALMPSEQQTRELPPEDESDSSAIGVAHTAAGPTNPDHAYKFELIFDLLMHYAVDPPPDLTADVVAMEVRRRWPRGTYMPYRVLEDIRHILRRDGRFEKLGTMLNESQRTKLQQLLLLLHANRERLR